MRLSSSQVSWPNSVAHSCPRESKASPCTLRCPIVHTGLPLTGLPGAGLPSGVIRRILPPSEPRSCASWSLPVSPVETNRLPSGANSSRPPSWMKPLGMPVSTGFGGPSRPPAYRMVTTRLSRAVLR